MYSEMLRGLSVNSYHYFNDSWYHQLQGQAVNLLGLLDPEDKATMIHQNVVSCSPNYTV
jgi:hypothetical protein